MEKELYLDFKNDDRRISVKKLWWNDGYEVTNIPHDAIDESDCGNVICKTINEAIIVFQEEVRLSLMEEQGSKSPNNTCLHCSYYDHIDCALSKMDSKDINHGDKIDCKICKYSSSHCGEDYYNCGDCGVDSYPLDE